MTDYELSNVHTWAPGVPVQTENFKHAPKRAQDAIRIREAKIVRNEPGGFGLCQCDTPELAEWIADRLNRYAQIEAELTKNNLQILQKP